MCVGCRMNGKGVWGHACGWRSSCRWFVTEFIVRLTCSSALARSAFDGCSRTHAARSACARRNTAASAGCDFISVATGIPASVGVRSSSLTWRRQIDGIVEHGRGTGLVAGRVGAPPRWRHALTVDPAWADAKPLGLRRLQGRACRAAPRRPLLHYGRMQQGHCAHSRRIGAPTARCSARIQQLLARSWARSVDACSRRPGQCAAQSRPQMQEGRFGLDRWGQAMPHHQRSLTVVSRLVAGVTL